MNEWGIPDWRNASAYGDTTQWGSRRWKWEFLRRRKDIRDDFDDKAPQVYANKLSLHEWDPSVSPDGVPRPDEPGFCVGSFLIDPSFPAPLSLPNPRISEQPCHCLPMVGDDSLRMVGKKFLLLEDGFARVDFDLNRPAGPQLAAAAEFLREAQQHRHGKVIQKRRHPEKWLSYLRVLDAREAGATWSQIASTVYGGDASSDQRARKAHEAGMALCFNF